ncbi:MAG: SDR family NAD(P)-dependent oxidoreductase [Solirubrobacterales bacterium]
MSGRLAGKRALITGAGRGIGRAAASRFAQEGARVALVDSDERVVHEAAQEVGDNALPCVADVREEDQVAAAAAEAVAAFGGLDALVGNAGVQLAGEDAPADRLELEVWERTLAINLTGMFLTCKHGIRALLASGGGAVVLTASPTGLFGCAPGFDAYSSSKAGVAGLVRVLASDYAAEGVRVNGIVPGYTTTPMTSWVASEEHADLLAAIPLGRPGRPEEVASVIAFMASEDASYVTGAIWAADGGMTAI